MEKIYKQLRVIKTLLEKNADKIQDKEYLGLLINEIDGRLSLNMDDDSEKLLDEEFDYFSQDISDFEELNRQNRRFYV